MNPNKVISANSKGIIISFRDVNKQKFVYYNDNPVVNHKSTPKKITKNFGLNQLQHRQYNQVVYGLKAIPQEVLMEMKTEAIKRIHNQHLKAKEIINNFKQEVSNQLVDNLLMKLFPRSTVAKQMRNVKGYDRSIKCNISLKDLEITPVILSKKLVEENL